MGRTTTCPPSTVDSRKGGEKEEGGNEASVRKERKRLRVSEAELCRGEIASLRVGPGERKGSNCGEKP